MTYIDPGSNTILPPLVAEGEQAISAFQTIRTMLDQAGLGMLAQWAWERWQAGASLDQISLELYDRPEFKAQYPEYDVLAAKGRAYSVGELQAYRKAVVGLMRQYGIPESFYDTPQDLAALAGAEVSVAEVSQRLAQAAQAVYESPQAVRDEFQRLYGVNSGDLIAYWLDPAKAEPLIKQNWTAAQISGAAQQSTYGQLTQSEAEALAQQGVDYQTAQQGFGALAQSQELFGAINSGESNISREVQLGAAFGGDATAQQEIERRRAQRGAEFSAGGGFAVNREGIAGA